MRPLGGRVAVVAGATRGTGRGVARALGEAGAIVYCTGRSIRGRPSPYARPETIEETAELVTAAGGKGIAVRVDHAIEGEVRELFERVEKERERLDVLVGCIAGEDPTLGGSWGTPFWEMDLSPAPDAMRQVVLSHLTTAKHAAPLMIRKKHGLIVEVTGGDLIIGGAGGTMLAELAKSAQKALAFLMSEELRPHHVAVLAVTPGFLRSESMLEHFGVTEATWRQGGKKDPHFLQSESPLFIGRAIAALAADKRVMSRSGDIVGSWELAREYGVTDADGSRPDWGTYFQQTMVPSMSWLRGGMERYVSFLDRAVGRARHALGDAAEVTAPRTRPSVAREEAAIDARTP